MMREFDKVKLGKDLCLIICCNINMSNHCTAVCRKAVTMLELVSRNFDHKYEEVMKGLYIAFVKPNIEYAI